MLADTRAYRDRMEFAALAPIFAQLIRAKRPKATLNNIEVATARWNRFVLLRFALVVLPQVTPLVLLAAAAPTRIIPADFSAVHGEPTGIVFRTDAGVKGCET